MNNQKKNSKLFIKLPNGDTLYENEVKKIINGELTIQKFINGFQLASRTSIINHLIILYDFKTYLEIGVRDSRNFDKINIEKKLGVDPNPLKKDSQILTLTSNKFFETNKIKFDIILIDGLHLEYQVDKDIQNSLKTLNNNGVIIMHDCNPPTKFHQRENYEVNGKFPAWNGTTWRSFAKLRINNDDLNMCCVDCDWGIGIIKKGSQKIFKIKQDLSYELLEKKRKKLLNLISVSEFIQEFS